MSVIFLAGVHGVGKGYLGSRVAPTLGMTHCTASQLIREEKGRVNWGADKVVTDVGENQIALIAGLERRRAGSASILLDGHFVLQIAMEEYVRLDLEVFRCLRLTGVILLVEDEMTIVQRLALRDSVSHNPASIARLAGQEAAHANFVCDALGIPLTILSCGNENSLGEAIRKFS